MSSDVRSKTACGVFQCRMEWVVRSVIVSSSHSARARADNICRRAVGRRLWPHVATSPSLPPASLRCSLTLFWRATSEVVWLLTLSATLARQRDANLTWRLKDGRRRRLCRAVANGCPNRSVIALVCRLRRRQLLLCPFWRLLAANRATPYETGQQMSKRMADGRKKHQQTVCSHAAAAAAAAADDDDDDDDVDDNDDDDATCSDRAPRAPRSCVYFNCCC